MSESALLAMIGLSALAAVVIAVVIPLGIMLWKEALKSERK